jgi:hypothetical protein
MIIGQTVFSVRRGTEHRAETAIGEVGRRLAVWDGVRSYRVMRSVGMSPLASALCDESREATLCDVHYIVQTEWDDTEAHDEFYASAGLQQLYAVLSSVLTSGPYEILYETLVEQREQSGVAV